MSPEATGSRTALFHYGPVSLMIWKSQGAATCAKAGLTTLTDSVQNTAHGQAF